MPNASISTFQLGTRVATATFNKAARCVEPYLAELKEMRDASCETFQSSIVTAFSVGITGNEPG